jgi:hypothetical protein
MSTFTLNSAVRGVVFEWMPLRLALPGSVGMRGITFVKSRIHPDRRKIGDARSGPGISSRGRQDDAPSWRKEHARNRAQQICGRHSRISTPAYLNEPREHPRIRATGEEDEITLVAALLRQLRCRCRGSRGGEPHVPQSPVREPGPCCRFLT